MAREATYDELREEWERGFVAGLYLAARAVRPSDPGLSRRLYQRAKERGDAVDRKRRERLRRKFGACLRVVR